MAKKRASSKKKTTKNTKSAKHDLHRGMKHFSKEVSRAGESFGRHLEAKGKQWEKGWHRTFGVFGPFIKSMFSLLILVVVSLVLALMNTVFGSPVLANISSFIFINAGFFFVLFLLFSYFSYLAGKRPDEAKAFSPLITALGIAISLWIIIILINIANSTLAIPSLSTIVFHVGRNIFWIFIAVIIAGYVIFGIRESMERSAPERNAPVTSGKRYIAPRTGSGIKRLYRSGNDKILGGVCGGIGEYMGVDPVLVRLLWVVFAFAFGGGILAYIIAWIIIPRNPGHRW